MRGEIYRLRPPRASGHEQQGPRYGVIVQASPLLQASTVIVAPTSRNAPPASWRPVIDLSGTETRVLVDKLAAVDVGHLGALAGYLSHDETEEIDTALRAVLAL
ncbi:MAG: type II toxin-antitoxin system PemK/MazF family toxin [Acidimicrobiia bacterium]|nr:type II toxin-antitoxin system PemK/MazF family toxin [Acidimicrobiia bacterium]